MEIRIYQKYCLAWFDIYLKIINRIFENFHIILIYLLLKSEFVVLNTNLNYLEML